MEKTFLKSGNYYLLPILDYFSYYFKNVFCWLNFSIALKIKKYGKHLLKGKQNLRNN